MRCGLVFPCTCVYAVVTMTTGRLNIIQNACEAVWNAVVPLFPVLVSIILVCFSTTTASVSPPCALAPHLIFFFFLCPFYFPLPSPQIRPSSQSSRLQTFDKCFLGSSETADANRVFCGQMGAVYLFGEALSAAQILAIYQLGPGYQVGRKKKRLNKE